ncbi:MAG: type IX secretion system outer membrane channel protein PorV [Bacteroidales bacterium]|jgi:hypothetical protein|nr:type IX secretion system outer membrane channel protein PorV [Bacteroidales bacterium]
MRKSVVSFVCIIFLASFTPAQSQTQNDPLGRKGSPITTSVPFLLIAPDSRIGGMGETGAAVPDDANAQHWNPAKYLFSEKSFGLSFSYSPWLAGLGVNDIHLLYLSSYYHVTDMDAISFSLRFFSMGEMELTGPTGEHIKYEKPNEFAIDAAYSRMLMQNATNRLSMAVTGRFIYSKLSSYTNSGGSSDDIKAGVSGAADVSLFYTKKLQAGKLYEHNFNLGLNISNIGAKISYSSSLKRDFLPANFRLGIAYEMHFDKYNKLLFAFDINKLLVTSPPIYQRDSMNAIVLGPDGEPIIEGRGRDPYKTTAAAAVFTSWGDAPNGFAEEMKEFILNVGMEYAYNNLLFVRAGFFHEAQNKGNRRYMTFGAGIKYSIFAIDAAYILPVSSRNNPLEHTLRFSISFELIPKKK